MSRPSQALLGPSAHWARLPVVSLLQEPPRAFGLEGHRARLRPLCSWEASPPPKWLPLHQAPSVVGGTGLSDPIRVLSLRLLSHQGSAASALKRL